MDKNKYSNIPDSQSETTRNVKQPLLEEKSSSKTAAGKINKKQWLRTDKENCIENFLFFGMSRVKYLVNLPEVTASDQLKIR